MIGIAGGLEGVGKWVAAALFTTALVLLCVLYCAELLGEGSSPVIGNQPECTAYGNVQTAVGSCPETPAVDTPTAEEPKPAPSPMCCPVWIDEDDKPEEGQTIYRVYGDRSGPLGQSWTPVDPRFVQNNPLLQEQWGRYAFRAKAGLPDWNSGSSLIIATLKDPGAVLPRDSLEHDTKLNPNGETWPGGLDEYFFLEPPQPGVDIEVIDWDIPLVPHY